MKPYSIFFDSETVLTFWISLVYGNGIDCVGGDPTLNMFVSEVVESVTHQHMSARHNRVKSNWLMYFIALVNHSVFCTIKKIFVRNVSTSYIASGTPVFSFCLSVCQKECGNFQWFKAISKLHKFDHSMPVDVTQNSKKISCVFKAAILKMHVCVCVCSTICNCMALGVGDKT